MDALINRVAKAFLIILFAIFLFALRQKALSGAQRVDSPGTADGDTVVHVDEHSISADYLMSHISVRPGPDYSQVTIEKRLEELITGEVLSKEAVRIGLDRRPDIRLQIQRILSQSLLEEKVNKPVREREISDRELRAYYDEHVDEFERPAQVRVADIFISVAQDASSGERVEKKAKAEKILAEVLAEENQRVAFGARMLKYSDTPGRYPRGNTGFFDVEGKPIGLSPSLARQAFKLKEAGQVCQQVIEAEDGYHIIMLTGRRDALSRPFERVKEQLRLRMYRERIELAQAGYIESLRQKARIEINKEVLDKFVKEQQTKAAAVNLRSKGGVPTLPRDVNVPPRKPRGPK